jgi:diaminopimelate epimerase
MKIPFTKAHGAQNDFLYTWSADLPVDAPYSAIAQAICHRHTGVGADGWYLISGPEQGCHIRIRLFNPDGGEVEMSGNGSRCAAAWALANGHATGSELKILSGAGPKSITLLEQRGPEYHFRMNMGLPQVVENELAFSLPLSTGPVDCTILNVGNPQCAVFVEEFPANWPAIGAEIERHPHFPQRTNVSFVRVLEDHSIDVRFFERGVGITNSSGTGSTGAMAAAVLRGLVHSPVTVNTPAGPLQLSWEDSIFLVGPAELTAQGEFFFFQ